MLSLIVAILITVLDQVTKTLVRYSFVLGESRPVINGFFDLTYLRNTGAAWGILGGHNTLLLFLSIIMLVLITLFRKSFLSDTWEHSLALGLLVGGIAGNLIDRVRLGYVVDFFNFHIAGYHWPVFNVADAAICVGVGIYIISAVWLSGHPLHEQKTESSKPSSSGDEPDNHA